MSNDQAMAAEDTGCAEGCAWVHRHYPNCPIWVTTCQICKRVNVADLIEQADKLRAELPERVCGRCHGPNRVWSAPSPLWNEVMRFGDINGSPDDLESRHGVICPTCFVVLAEEAGVASRWRLYAMRVDVPLQTVTPSGRVWNEQTWMFDEPQQIEEGK